MQANYHMASLAHFQDRERAIEAFDRLWDSPAPWVLAFTGFSGHGKSTLLDWLEVNRCQPQKIPYAYISVGEYAAEIRGALHHLLETRATNLRERLPSRSQKHYQIKRRAALEERNRRRLVLTQRQEMSGSQGAEQSMSADLVEALREMERQADELVFDAWLECMAALSNKARLVFMLDDYDLFQSRAAVGDLERFWALMERARARVPGLRRGWPCAPDPGQTGFCPCRRPRSAAS